MPNHLKMKEVKELYETTKNFLLCLGDAERTDELEKRVNNAETEKEVVDIIKEYVDLPVGIEKVCEDSWSSQEISTLDPILLLRMGLEVIVSGRWWSFEF